MARRKLTVVEQAIKDAAAELKLPKDHWDVERLATLNVMLRVARHKWSQGQAANDANQMLALMDSITTLRKEARLNEPLDIKIHFVRGKFTGRCSHCGKSTEYSDRPFDEAESGVSASPVEQRMGDAANGSQTHPTDDPAVAARDSNRCTG
jgi:hypothetical protein